MIARAKIGSVRHSDASIMNFRLLKWRLVSLKEIERQHLHIFIQMGCRSASQDYWITNCKFRCIVLHIYNGSFSRSRHRSLYQNGPSLFGKIGYVRILCSHEKIYQSQTQIVYNLTTDVLTRQYQNGWSRFGKIGYVSILCPHERG